MEAPAFDLHPSSQLVDMFRKKPYQGQAPERAAVIFLSSDANYSANITRHPFFTRILDYHRDPIQFWRDTGVHHPFLLGEYPFDRRKDGVPFHRKFAAMGLTSDYADKICFLELLDVPTIGIKSKARPRFRTLLNPVHMTYLQLLLTSGKSRTVFVSDSVLRDLKYLDKQGWQDYSLWNSPPLGVEQGVPLIYQHGATRVYKVTHFSGSISQAELRAIRTLIDSAVQQSVSTGCEQ